MSLIEIKPKRSALRYHPRAWYFCLFSEVEFHLNTDTMEFEINQNPHGESNSVPIFNIKSMDNFSKLMFDSFYRYESTNFVLSSPYECDRILYKILTSDISKKIDFLKEDKDKVELAFENGVISTIDIFKHVNRELVDSIAVFVENNELILLERDPWARKKINSLTIENNEIHCRMQEKEVIYQLDLQPFIYDSIKKLIEVSLPKQINI